MPRNGYINDFYRQFEELNKKLDKLLKENKEQALIISSLKVELEQEKEKNKVLLQKIDKLLEERDKLNNKNNKNSSNSSKPSSTDMYKPKKTGADLYNSRVNTGKKPGGQVGHKGNGITKEDMEKSIKDKNLKVVEIEHYINGNSSK